MIDLDRCKIIDISPVICSELAVFPGDKSFQRDVAMDFDKGDHLRLSQMTTTMHIGAHADSPGHYHKMGEGIDTRSLHFYLGHCQVVSSSAAPGERIKTLDQPICSKRILIRTDSFSQPNNWTDQFNSLDPGLVTQLVDQGVILIGIDTPSVDPADCKDLLAHQIFFNNDLAILEGLVLSEAEPGEYQLVSLPLKIKDADASPVRAVLLQVGSDPL